jgi:hypothetical protein
MQEAEKARHQLDGDRGAAAGHTQQDEQRDRDTERAHRLAEALPVHPTASPTDRPAV